MYIMVMVGVSQGQEMMMFDGDDTQLGIYESTLPTPPKIISCCINECG